MSFSNDIEKFEKDVVVGSETVIKNVFIRAARYIITHTPVLTGKARSNWFSSFNTISDETTEDTNGKSARLRESKNIVKKFKLGGFFSNDQ